MEQYTMEKGQKAPKNNRKVGYQKYYIGSRICAILCAVCLTLGVIALQSGAKSVSAMGELSGYTIKTSRDTGAFRYANYIKGSGATQEQSLFYGEINLAKQKDYKLISYAIPSNSGGFSLHTVSDFVKDYEKKTTNKVLMAVNGTFFDWGSESNPGLKPWFSFVEDGELLQQGAQAFSDTVDNGMAWNDDGEILIGKLSEHKASIQLQSGLDKEYIKITKENVAPANGEYSVYTSGTFNVGASFNAYKIALDKKVNRTLVDSSGADEIFESKYGGSPTLCSDTSITVGANEMYIVVGKASNINSKLAKFTGKVNYVPTPAGAHEKFSQYLATINPLVKGGAKCDIYTGTSHNKEVAPRTTVGFKSDGTAFLSVIDGRQTGYSKGLTVMEQCDMAVEFGAHNAVELDGGGSSVFMIRENDKMSVKSLPSDINEGKHEERAVINAVMIVKVFDESTVSAPNMVVDANNGEVSVKFDDFTNGALLTLADFSAKAVINEVETDLVLANYSYNEVTNTAKMSFPAIDGSSTESKSVAIKMSVKGGTSVSAPFDIGSDLAQVTVSASNGEIVVSLGSNFNNGESLTLADFSAKAILNGSESPLTLSDLVFDANAKTIKMKYTALPQTDKAQTVIVKVKIKGTDKTANAFVINALGATKGGCFSTMFDKTVGIALFGLLAVSALIIRRKSR